jgi:pyruvate dehydrogenase E1 component alpha subunit
MTMTQPRKPSDQPAAPSTGRGAPAGRRPAAPAEPVENEPAMDQVLLLDLLRKMLLIRRFEEKAAEMYSLGKIGGFLHLYIGQEAVAVGALSVLRPDDYVITGYRDHGHALALGSDPGRCMAELFGRATGLSRGKGGSMHFFDKERNLLGGTGVVGGQLPIGTGVGFAINYRGGDQVCACFFGDGAVNQGIFHESLNMAGLWKLPVIYLCENNRYAMGTSIERGMANLDIAGKAAAYGMPGLAVDGMDVLAVRDAVAKAVDVARRDKRPCLIEARTYRFRGHSMRDPTAALYRTRAEVEEERKRDPITLLEDRLRTAGLASEQEVKALDAEVRRVVEEAVRFAEESPEPPLNALLEDVFVEEGADR